MSMGVKTANSNFIEKLLKNIIFEKIRKIKISEISGILLFEYFGHFLK